MNVVAAYHVFVCAFFVVQGDMFTGYSQSTYLPVANSSFPQFCERAVSLYTVQGKADTLYA